MTVSDGILAKAISAQAERQGKTAGIHIKVDTGMSRLGISPGSVVELAKGIGKPPGLRIAGVYTHLATAAELNMTLAQDQLRRFREVIWEFNSEQIEYGLAHTANSAAIMTLPSGYGIGQPGTILYGQYPSAHIPPAGWT